MVELDDRLKKALTDFTVVCSSVCNELMTEVSSRPIPEYIYHYTTDEGLRGILESGNLHLTSIYSLNDPSEIRHGFSKAVEILSGLAKSGTAEQKYFAARFEDIYRKNIERTAHFFALSFSKNSDELGQWRAYANDGKGYALVFDTHKIEQDFINEIQAVVGTNSSFDVRYDNIDMHRRQDNLVRSMFNLIQLPYSLGLPNSQVNFYEERLSMTLATWILQVALFYKHEGYAVEEEYRFLQAFNYLSPVPGMEHRFRRDEVVKFRKFKWCIGDQLSLKKVIIGPAALREKSYRYVADCLELFGYTNVGIEYSGIPYRSHA